MTKEQEKELIDIKVRQQLKQVELERAENDEQLEARKAELEKINKELRAAEKEIEEIEKENQEILDEERKKMENKEVRKVTIETPEERAAQVKKIEERATALLEGRSVTVASSEILVHDHQADNLATYPFQTVSSLIDLVDTKPLDGGETHEVAFVKGYGEGDMTAEGADYATAEPEFGYATIAKAKVTAYAEISEEVLKLPKVNYEAEVRKGVEVALRKKMSQQIIAGAGTTNTFKGITADSVEALEASDVVPVAEITDKTLDEILFSFGGDEEVLGTGVLILNKLDLKAFATLRNTDGTKTYNVDYKAKTIDGIPYIINSHLPSLAKATAGQTSMLFGTPKGYEVDIFSPVEIMKSTDYKFKQGIVCYKASVFAGGNVKSYRSFVKVTKE